ncbi:unnamed protein product [Urochloa humidicola]
MELVPNCPPGLRIFEQSFDPGYPSPRERSDHRSRLLNKIHSSYCKALERLSLRARPGMAARFIDGGGGFCLGLLDPVSNVVANTLLSYGRRAESDDPVPGECGELVYVPESKLRDLERRSLEGMVTFLTRFFPYLADCEAVRVLRYADADLLVAFRIVASDLGVTRLSYSEPAFKEAFVMALRCAALVAKHPSPDRLVADWLAISTRLPETVRLLAEVRRRSPASSLGDLAKLLDGLPQPAHDDGCEGLWAAWELMVPRLPPPRSVPCLYSPALKGTLQDAIHGFYLKALARLPAGELRSRFHRSLLIAGHCYGPFDPVSNIIVNTIWYDAAFPPTVKLEMDTIGTFILHRTENCSLYGMVSFLCTRYHHIDFHQALRGLLDVDGYLFQADGTLNLDLDNINVDPEIRDILTTPTCEFPPRTGMEEAFFAAATAACHPKPEAQAKFLFQCSNVPMLGDASVLLQGDGQLSSQDVQCLAKLLCPEAACSEQPLPSFRHTWYLSEHTRMSKKINDALSAYAVMPNGEPMYELHTICGVNKYVSGPVGTVAKCYRSHVNFLATPKGTQFSAGTNPVLFFAEVSNDDKVRAGTQSFCCSVPLPIPCSQRVRCLFCDYMGIKIVHPIGEDFHGRKLEFEKMVCGEDPCNHDFIPEVMQPFYTNTDIIEHSQVTSDRVNGRVEEDCLYNDPSGDSSDGYDSDLTLLSDEVGLHG